MVVVQEALIYKPAILQTFSIRIIKLRYSVPQLVLDRYMKGCNSGILQPFTTNLYKVNYIGYTEALT